MILTDSVDFAPWSERIMIPGLRPRDAELARASRRFHLFLLASRESASRQPCRAVHVAFHLIHCAGTWDLLRKQTRRNRRSAAETGTAVGSVPGKRRSARASGTTAPLIPFRGRNQTTGRRKGGYCPGPGHQVHWGLKTGLCESESGYCHSPHPHSPSRSITSRGKMSTSSARSLRMRRRW